MADFGAFAAFHNSRFTLYFAGQVISNTGTWFQNLALSLVILGATGSAQSLSGVTIAQFLPILLLSIPAGRLADRVRPRTILLWTSAASLLIAAGLAIVVGSDPAGFWAVYALVALLGTANAFERVAAQAIIYEIVGPRLLTRAVSISTIALAAARSIGPGLAGIAFAAFGPVVCMLVNAASYLVVFAVILSIRPGRLHRRVPADPAAAPERPVLRNRDFVTLLVVNVAIALLSLNLMLVLTSTVTLTFEGDATAVGVAHTLNAVGAIVGGMLAALPAATTIRALAGGCAALGGALLLNGLAPALWVFLLLGPVLGLGVGYYHGVLNAAAQAAVPPAQLGRAMSLVTLGNYGMAPLGAAFMGWIIDVSSGRVALLIGGTAGLAAAGFVWLRTRRGTGR